MEGLAWSMAVTLLRSRRSFYGVTGMIGPFIDDDDDDNDDCGCGERLKRRRTKITRTSSSVCLEFNPNER